MVRSLPASVLALRVDDDADYPDPVDLVADRECSLLEVDVFPAEAEDFAFAETECQRHCDDRLLAVATNGAQEAPHVISGGRGDCASG
jgi:hypothetical protein